MLLGCVASRPVIAYIAHDDISSASSRHGAERRGGLCTRNFAGCVASADEVGGSGMLVELNAYAGLPTNSGSNLQQLGDPAFDERYHATADNDLSLTDTALPPSYCKSVDAGAGATADDRLLPDAGEEAGAREVAAWDSLADLEFPRDALGLVDTLGTSSFGEVRLHQTSVREYVFYAFLTFQKT